ncbi:hypothetical protein [uncultured Sphingomonas sp.]|uniref:helix-turn-helix transcriptional regulator n=1 Tax=uncultured Sphingomonas sp. TaxID=158754 RepID=UPI0025E593DF|nr:hypothetical protein [uncultured Sphingomonas sp.]
MESLRPLDSAGSRVAELLADAPLSADGWAVALKALAEYTDAGRAQLIGFGAIDALPFNLFVGMDPIPSDKQIESGGTDPDRSWRLGSSGATLKIVGEEDYAARRNRPQSDAYNAVCEAWDIPYGAQTILWDDDSAKVGIATFRGFREGPGRREHEMRFAAIAPHARTAVRMQRAIECQGESLTFGAIDALGVAAFLLDRSGRVVMISPKAEIALRQGALRLEGGRLVGRTAVDDGVLRTAIGRALRGLPQLSERLWLSSRDDRFDRSWCEVYALPRRDWATLFRPHVLVTIDQTRPLACSNATVLALRQLLQLTPSEADVAVRLANGEARSDIADARQTSIGTVSVQLKSIFQKSQTRREGELISLINRLMGRK